MIARDEVKDLDEAVENFSKALDDVPTMSKAFDAVEKIRNVGGELTYYAYSEPLADLADRPAVPRDRSPRGSERERLRPPRAGAR